MAAYRSLLRIYVDLAARQVEDRKKNAEVAAVIRRWPAVRWEVLLGSREIARSPVPLFPEAATLHGIADSRSLAGVAGFPRASSDGEQGNTVPFKAKILFWDHLGVTQRVPRSQNRSFCQSLAGCFPAGDQAGNTQHAAYAGIMANITPFPSYPGSPTLLLAVVCLPRQPPNKDHLRTTFGSILDLRCQKPGIPTSWRL